MCIRARSIEHFGFPTHGFPSNSASKAGFVGLSTARESVMLGLSRTPADIILLRALRKTVPHRAALQYKMQRKLLVQDYGFSKSGNPENFVRAFG
jgi:hypothetical protein